MKTVLVVEDEANIRSFIVVNMERAGYHVLEADSGEKALEVLSQNTVGVTLLDVMLPGIDGFEVCRRIRATNQKMGVIMLTAKSQENDKVMGLMTGADDYVTKPFSPAELTARVDALYRRSGGDEVDRMQGDLAQGPFLLNTKNQSLLKNGERIRITQVEYGLLKYFMEHVGKIVTREELLSAVWGEQYGGELKTVDVNIRRLRMKIEENPQIPSYITTVWGAGYKWSY